MFRNSREKPMSSDPVPRGRHCSVVCVGGVARTSPKEAGGQARPDSRGRGRLRVTGGPASVAAGQPLQPRLGCCFSGASRPDPSALCLPALCRPLPCLLPPKGRRFLFTWHLQLLLCCGYRHKPASQVPLLLTFPSGPLSHVVVVICSLWERVWSAVSASESCVPSAHALPPDTSSVGRAGVFHRKQDILLKESAALRSSHSSETSKDLTVLCTLAKEGNTCVVQWKQSGFTDVQIRVSGTLRLL